MLNFYLSILSTDEEKSEFERLYHVQKNIMYHIAYSKLNNSHDAEDAVHEAFLRCAKNFSRILEIPCNKRGAFLDVIVRNVAVDMFKKKCNAPDDIEDYAFVTDNAPQTEETALGNIGRDELMERIKGMPEPLRDTLSLSAFCDMTNKEIADFLGVSENTVAQRLFRARKIIAEEIKKG